MALIFGNKVYTDPHEISSNDSLVFPRYKLIRLDTTLNPVKVSQSVNELRINCKMNIKRNITFKYTKVIYS